MSPIPPARILFGCAFEQALGTLFRRGRSGSSAVRRVLCRLLRTLQAADIAVIRPILGTRKVITKEIADLDSLSARTTLR
jgi:hypothetical protein